MELTLMQPAGVSSKTVGTQIAARNGARRRYRDASARAALTHDPRNVSIAHACPPPRDPP